MWLNVYSIMGTENDLYQSIYFKSISYIQFYVTIVTLEDLTKVIYGQGI
jgi:hypothetical protein